MSNATKPRVLDVGQCNFDHGNISRLLSEEFSAEVHRSMTSDEALHSVENESFDLVLVNRVFDANGESGLDLIRKLQSANASKSMTIALVSNFSDAQNQAIALGASKGFGKSDLTSQATRETLATLLGT